MRKNKKLKKLEICFKEGVEKIIIEKNKKNVTKMSNGNVKSEMLNSNLSSI